jgi:photosystem II stability/assembly factor-like uncharacterized protein
MSSFRWLTLCAMMIAAMLFGACEREAWKQVAQLPTTFESEAVIAAGSGDALVGGSESSAGARSGSAASILRVRGATFAQVFSAPHGGVYAFASNGTTLWALLRQETPEGVRKDVVLLVSRDQGGHWESVGPVPEHAGSLVATGPSELWVLGVETLLRSTDGGHVWQRISAPGRRSSITEKIVQLTGGRVAIAGAGLLVLDRAGSEFVRTIPEDVEVQCAHENMIVGRSRGAMRVGTLDGDGNLLQWVGALPDSVEPFALQVAGASARILALRKAAALPLSGIRLFTTSDGGRKWSSSKVDAQASPSFASLGPAGSGIAIGLEGEVLAPR